MGSLKLGFLLLCLLVSTARAEDKAELQNARLGAGINLANYFESAQSQVLRRSDIEQIKEAGFQSVRIPVAWTKFIANQTIEPNFLRKVEQAITWCFEEDLCVVLNVHHFSEMHDDPDRYEDFLVALWQMIAVKLAGYDDRLMFELFNEPQKQLTVDRWNITLAKLHQVIRGVAPNRTLLIGSAEFNGWWTLDRLKLPETDRNIIASVHYYSPMAFTHQGAEWMQERKNDRPMPMPEPSPIAKEFDAIRDYAIKSGRPINIGEFGVYQRIATAIDSAKWVNEIVARCKASGFSYHYWEYNAGFGIYRNGRWNPTLTKILTDK